MLGEDRLRREVENQDGRAQSVSTLGWAGLVLTFSSQGEGGRRAGQVLSPLPPLIIGIGGSRPGETQFGGLMPCEPIGQSNQHWIHIELPLS